MADAFSSLGGRCRLDPPRHRQLVPFDGTKGVLCNFVNGTAGVKCKGSAITCKGITDFSKILCGSCLGDSKKAYMASSADLSCSNSNSSCYFATNQAHAIKDMLQSAKMHVLVLMLVSQLEAV